MFVRQHSDALAALDGFVSGDAVHEDEKRCRENVPDEEITGIVTDIPLGIAETDSSDDRG